jgi:hypothetical protein
MKARGLSIILVAVFLRTSVLDAGTDDAATFYEQAIAALPTEPTDVQAFEHWTSVPIDASTLGIVQRCQQSRLLLHQGAQAAKCDWGWDYKKGPALQIPELGRLRHLGAAAALWIRASIEQRHEAEAVQSIEDLLILGRRVASAPLVLTGLQGRSSEALGMYVAAAYLKTLSPASLQQIQSFIATLPTNPPLAEALTKESAVTVDVLLQASAKGGNGPFAAVLPKQPGEATRAIFACQDLFTDAVRIASLPPDQATQASAAFKTKADAAPPLWRKVGISDPAQISLTEAHYREDVALFSAAIKVVREGPAAVQSTSDPMGGGPFSYRQIPNGFELVSKLIDRGQAVTVQVGPEALAAEAAPAKKPIPTNWVKMTNRAHHFEYFVPPTWTHFIGSDVEIQFQIPVHPNKNVFGFGMFVVAVRPTQTATLEDDAAEERKQLLRERPGAKPEITKEGKVDFNGKPAWRFEYSEVREMTNEGGAPLPPGMKPPKETTRRLEIVVHEGQNHFLILYQIIAVTNGAGIYNQFLPQAQQVFDSFEWNK